MTFYSTNKKWSKYTIILTSKIVIAAGSVQIFQWEQKRSIIFPITWPEFEARCSTDSLHNKNSYIILFLSHYSWEFCFTETHQWHIFPSNQIKQLKISTNYRSLQFMNIMCVGKYIVQMQYFWDWIDFQFQTYMKYERHP